MFAIGIEILAVESKKWQGYFESVFTGLPVIIEWFLRCFIDATLKYSQLPFQNGIAIVCQWVTPNFHKKSSNFLICSTKVK